MNLFFKTTRGRFTPSWKGEIKRRYRDNVQVNGSMLQIFPDLKTAAAQKSLFQTWAVNFIE